MDSQLKEIVEQYDSKLPLDRASTIPSSWYTDKSFFWHELKTVFSRSWQLAARREQVTEPGNYVTTDIAGDPVVIVRGNDNVLRAFFNVCRHHAAAVMTEAEGYLDKQTELGPLTGRIGFEPEPEFEPSYDRFVVTAPLLVASR